MQNDKIEILGQLPADTSPMRLDVALAQMFPDYSRAQLQGFIRDGQVWVNGDVITKTRYMVSGGTEIKLIATAKSDERWHAQDIPIDIIYEDDDIMAINKPAGMIVHPGAGVSSDTLVNALLHHAPELDKIPRAGLIHRLDKDTTGLLVIAKTLPAHNALTQQMQNREIKRCYQAVVHGPLISGGSVDAAISRHPTNRTKMAVSQTGGRHAITHYRVLNRYRYHTHLSLQLETGRTHQIRVHMNHIRHPIVGDPVYSRPRIPRDCCDQLKKVLEQFKRQALHAFELTITHPVSKQTCHWQAPLPDDFQELLQALDEDDKQQQ